MNRLAVVLAFFSLALAAWAGNRKGDKLLEEGRKAEASKQYGKALDLYEAALALDPSDSAYLLAARRVRFQAGQLHVDRGQKLRLEGKLEEALKEFQKAFIIDPASTIAEQEVRRTNEAIELEKRKAATPGSGDERPENRGLSAAQTARLEAERKSAAIMGVPELRPLSREITNVKMVNQKPKVLYETIGKLTGVNILMDAEYQDMGKTYSLDLTNTTLEEALDYVSLLTKTFWKPLSANAIFVTQDTAVKRRDYEEHVTRVFYLQNVTSAQELQEAMTAMRAITDVRKVFPFNSQSAIVVRGTVDQVNLAEKILLDLDKPKPEVVVDVFVMEANRTKTRDLAATITSGGRPGFSTTIGYSPIGADSSSVRLNEIGKISSADFVLTMPSILLQALMSDRKTRVLTQPQVRATDGQKATLRLGDRYPYATGSFQPGIGIGGGGVSPLVSTQFQFADVGVNVDLTPRIHGADEVSLQIVVDITNIRETVDIGGLSQPVIGQRKVEHIIRIREGETTLIGGLMQVLRSRSRSGLPGLMQIPILGAIFSSNNDSDTDSELLVALVPHIVRAPEITRGNLKTIASGTETIWKLNYAQPAGSAAAPAPAGAKPAAAPAQLPGLPAPAAAPVKPSAAPSPAAPPPPNAPPAAGLQPAVLFSPPAAPVAAGSTFSVTVQAQNMADLFNAPMRIAYDPKLLRLLEVSQGPLLSSDGQKVIFTDSKAPDEGKVFIRMDRISGAGGVNGSGALLTLRFQALSKGEATLGFEELTLRDAKLQSIPVALPKTTVQIQ